MNKFLKLAGFIAIASSAVSVSTTALAKGTLLSGMLTLSPFFMGQSGTPDCGTPLPSVDFYDSISFYSVIVGVALVLVGILIDKKEVKIISWSFAVVPIALWGYVNFAVDYEEINQTIFAYNVRTEAALANIAEGQERYKSEHGFYLKDLNKLYSHLAGAHGVDKCIRILELKTSPQGWSASAQHVNSPDKVYWDGKSGSSLKKG